MSYYLMGDSGTVTFEAFRSIVSSEGVTRGNKVTSNPVESGSPVTDHAIPNAIKLDVQAIIADDPDAIATLETMAQSRDLIQYRGAQALDDLIITSLAITRNGTTGERACNVKLSLQQVTLVSAAFVPITGPTMSASDKSKRRSGSKAKGAKGATNTGLIIPRTGYSNYVDGFSGDVVPKNPYITSARTNPSYRGYGYAITSR